MNQSYVFGVVQIPDPPWTMIHCMKEDQNGFLYFLPACGNRLGTAMEATFLTAKYLGLNIRYVWTANWGSQKKGSWTGGVGDLMSHKIDSVVPQVSPTHDRSHAVRFTGYMFMNQESCFTYCFPHGTYVGFHLSKLFTSPLLVLLLLVLSLLLSFIALLIASIPTDKVSWRQRCFRALDLLLAEFVIMSRKLPLTKSWKESMVAGSLGIFCLFFFNFIRSKLMASFISFEPIPFRDANDLAHKVAANELKVVMEFPNQQLWSLLLEEFIELAESVKNHPQNVLYRSQGHDPSGLVLRNQNIVRFRISAPSEWEIKEYKRKHPDVRDISCVTNYACRREAIPDGFIVAMDRPQLYEQLVQTTRRLRQFGLIQKIESDYHMNENLHDWKGRAKVAAGSPDFIDPAMTTLAFGSGGAFLVFLVELTNFWLKAQRNQRLKFLAKVLQN